MKRILSKSMQRVAIGTLAKVYKVTSIAPGMSPFVVNSRVEGIEFQVRATGAATKHFVDAAKGSVDFLFGSPTIN